MSTISPFLILTAPISVILSFRADSPVVSISKTTISSRGISLVQPVTISFLSLIRYASTPYMIFMSLSISMASGKACTTPWSVMAIAGCPHSTALFIKALTGVTPSIELIFVCIWSSTLFLLALSFSVSFSFNSRDLAIMTVSFE